jgi:hypothetical protein
MRSARSARQMRESAMDVPRGAVAQLGERRVRNAKVVGSTPIGSTNIILLSIAYIFRIVLRHIRPYINRIPDVVFGAPLMPKSQFCFLVTGSVAKHSVGSFRTKADGSQ